MEVNSGDSDNAFGSSESSIVEMNRKRTSSFSIQSPKKKHKKKNLEEINCENKNIGKESCQVESPTKNKDKEKKLNHDSVSEDTNNFRLKTQTEFDNVTINESPQRYKEVDKSLKRKKSSLTTSDFEDLSPSRKETNKSMKKRKSSEDFEFGDTISQIKPKHFVTERMVESTGKLSHDLKKSDKTPKKNQILKTPKYSNVLTTTEINCLDSNSEDDIEKPKFIDKSHKTLQKKNKLKSLSLEKSFSMDIEEIEDSKKQDRNSIQKTVTPSTKLIKNTKEDHVCGESGEFAYKLGDETGENKLHSSPKKNRIAKSKKSHDKNENGSVSKNDSNIDHLRKSLLHQAKKSLSSPNILLNAELESNNLSSFSKNKNAHTPLSHEHKSSTLISPHKKLLKTKKEQSQVVSIARESEKVISSADGKKIKCVLPEKKTKKAKSKQNKVPKNNPRIENLTKKLLLKALERVSSKTSSNFPNDEFKESSNILPQNLSHPVLEKVNTKQNAKREKNSGKNNIKSFSKTTKLIRESELHKSLTQSKRRKKSVLGKDPNIEDLTKELLSKALNSISTATSDKSFKRLPKKVIVSSQKQSKPVLLKKDKSTNDQNDNSTLKPVKNQVEAIRTNKKSDNPKLKTKKNINIEELRSKLLSNALIGLSSPTSNDMLNSQPGGKNKKKAKQI